MANRGLSDAQNTYLARDALIGITLIHIPVPDGTDRYYTDCPFDITVNGQNYTAQGNFLGISEATETGTLQVTNISITISALDSNEVTDLGRSEQINQTVTIRKAFLNQPDLDLVGDSAGDTSILIFKGKINGYRIEDSRDTATITLEVNSQFTNFRRKTGRRTNQSNFQKEHPQDHSMEFSHETLQDIKWGKV
jgi:hypothetical protein